MSEKFKRGLLFGLGYVVVKWLIIGLVGTWLYKNGYWENWYIIFIPAVGLIVFLIRKWLRLRKSKIQAALVTEE